MQPSDDILQHFSPADQADLEEEAKDLGVSVNYLIAVAAQYARHTIYNQIATNETKPIPADLRR